MVTFYSFLEPACPQAKHPRNCLNKIPYIFSFASIYCCQASWELPPDSARTR